MGAECLTPGMAAKGSTVMDREEGLGETWEGEVMEEWEGVEEMMTDEEDELTASWSVSEVAEYTRS